MDSRSSAIELRRTMEAALPAGDGPAAIALSGYRLDEALIQHLDQAAGLLCDRAGSPELHEALFAAARVMLLNGLRANVKEVVFREYDFRPGNLDQYRGALEAFRIALSSGYRNLFAAYGSKFKDFALPVELILAHHPGVFIVEAVNRFGLNPDDEISIRKKLERARSNYELFEFFEEGEQDASGHETIYRAARALERFGITPRLFLVHRPEEPTSRAVLLLPRPGTGWMGVSDLFAAVEANRSPAPPPNFEKLFDL